MVPSVSICSVCRTWGCARLVRFPNPNFLYLNDVFDKWVEFIGDPELKKQTRTEIYFRERLCTLHFREEDIIYDTGDRAHVKQGAVPVKRFPLGLRNDRHLCRRYVLDGPLVDEDIGTIQVPKHNQCCSFKRNKNKHIKTNANSSETSESKINKDELSESELNLEQDNVSESTDKIQTTTNTNVSNPINENIIAYENEMNNLKKLCRVCLVNDSDLTPIDNFTNSIMELVPINLALEKSLPNKICQQCLNMLRTAILFRQICTTSDQKLKTIAEKYNIASKILDTPSEDSKKVNITTSCISVQLKDNERNKIEESEIVINNNSNSPEMKNLTKQPKLNSPKLERDSDMEDSEVIDYHDNTFNTETLPKKPRLDNNVEQTTLENNENETQGNNDQENLPFVLRPRLRIRIARFRCQVCQMKFLNKDEFLKHKLEHIEKTDLKSDESYSIYGR